MAAPSYITVPSSAYLISPPTAGQTSSSAASNATVQPNRLPRPFPPSSSTQATTAASTRKFSAPSSLTTNVSDLLLSSLLPPNLPKLPQTSKGGSGQDGEGRVLELTSRREGLSLPLVSNNFRRFITRVGPVFWLQDRIQEVLFWRKPVWTCAWLLLWTFISFKPRTLLLIPSVSLLLILLHIHERSSPLPSLLGVSMPPPTAGTTRMSSPQANSGSVSTSTGQDGETIPVVPPKEAESGADVYMNVQAIQNLMGLVSDAHDVVAPWLTTITSPPPVPPPTSFPISLTLLVLLLLPPSLLLPLVPSSLVPFLLLPVGYLPPLLLHPTLMPIFLSLPRHPLVLRARTLLETLVLTDSLSDEDGRKELSKVEVYENERLDPNLSAKVPLNALPAGSWSSRHLRAGERGAWVKVGDGDGDVDGGGDSKTSTKWKNVEEHVGVVDDDQDGEGKDGEREVLALKEGWGFLNGEDWRVDVCGLWSGVGTDDDGWVYSDDSWQTPSHLSLTDADPSSGSAMPGLAVRKVTRRRKWCRRVGRDGDNGKDGL